jgi:SAM-dependent methyltransferase
MAELHYVGNELELFAAAKNWKSYWSSKVKPYISGTVAEIGAGLGTNTSYLVSSAVSQWTFIEPDPGMVLHLQNGNALLHSAIPHSVYCGTLADLEETQFDTIVYIDVLEHIRADGDEISLAARALKDGGTLIVLSPAYQYLFSPFDAAIGHFRRYNRSLMTRLTVDSLEIVDIFYLDSAGLLLSLANKVLLRRDIPTGRQIWVWDTFVVPVSRVVDRFLFHKLGKTIVGVWRKRDSGGRH